MSRRLAAASWVTVAVVAALDGWPVSAVLVCLPGLVAGSLLLGADDGRRRIGALLGLGSLAAVLAVAPSALGVAALVDPDPGDWSFRIAALAPLALGALRGTDDAPPPAVRWLIALAVWAMVVAVATPLPAQSALAGFELLVVVVVTVRLVGFVGIRDAVPPMAIGLAAVGAAALAVELLEVEPPALPGFQEDTALGLSRLFALSTEPIQLAEALGGGVVLAAAWAFDGRWRWLALPVAGVAGVAVLATQSRVGVIAVAVAVLWMALRRRHLTPVALAALAAAVGLTVLGLGGVEIGPLDELLTIRGETDGADVRVKEIWPSGVDRFLERPLQGWGLAGTEEAFQRSMDDGGIRPLPVRNAHNRLLELAVATGVVGVVLAALALASMVSSFARHRNPAAEALLVYVLLVGLTGPGSGSLFTGVDELLIAVAAAATAGPRPGIRTAPDPTSVPRHLLAPG
ncbi:MAG: O-antigen ligase family protein [Actinomycetota bacterium]